MVSLVVCMDTNIIMSCSNPLLLESILSLPLHTHMYTHTHTHTHTGSCVAAGYTECCNDSNCVGLPVEDCYCDTNCHLFGDCCADINNTCPAAVIPPSGQFILDNSNYRQCQYILMLITWLQLCRTKMIVNGTYN